MDNRKFLIMKCTALHDQHETDYDRTPIKFVDDYRDYIFRFVRPGEIDGFSGNRSGYEVYSINTETGWIARTLTVSAVDEIVRTFKSDYLAAREREENVEDDE
jgi:hypothetical protein